MEKERKKKEPVLCGSPPCLSVGCLSVCGLCTVPVEWYLWSVPTWNGINGLYQLGMVLMVCTNLEWY